MRSHYNIILFDGSYFLFRNQVIFRGSATANKLAGSLIQTVVKIVRDANITFDVGFLAFDKKPYHRTQILHGKYKDTRDEFTEEDLTKVRNLIDQSDGDEKVNLENRLHHMEECIKQLNIRHDAIDILSNFGSYGLTTLSYAGYEADDIARIIKELYGDRYSILIVSIDSDWIGLVDENVDYLRVRHKGVKDFYNSDSIKGYPDYVNMRDEGLEEMGLAWYLEIMEAMGVGHNDMRKCWDPAHPITIGEIVANWDDLEQLKDEFNFDVDTFKRQVSTFEFKKFPDYGKVTSDILNKKYNLSTSQGFNGKFIYELCTGISFGYYRRLYDCIRNYSLLQLY